MEQSAVQPKNEKKDERIKALEKVIDSIFFPVVILDRHLKALTGNNTFCELFGQRKDRLGWKGLHELLPVKAIKKKRLARLILKVIHRGESVEIKEIECTPDDAEKRIYNMRFIKMKGGGFVMLLMDDVTDKVRLGEELRQAQKMSAIGQFTAGLLHEVNNPISIISGHAQYLLGRLGKRRLEEMTSEDLKECRWTLKVITKESRRIGELGSKLLQFSRRADSQMKPVHIDRSIGDTLRFLEHQLKLSDIRIIKVLAKDLPTIIGNESQLRQVLLNLLMNAHQSMPHGGKLFISTSSQNGRVQIKITNTGRRIPKEYLGRIFDPFFTTRKGGTGTGLGLSIVYSIIKAHRGTITAESDRRKGTTFTITLPVQQGLTFFQNW